MKIIFTYKDYRKMPDYFDNDEIVVKKMDLYLTINMTENLYNARIERKK
jgi:hypothetical protein